MSAPRSEAHNVRGWKTEFKCWWKMAKYVDVVFDKSRNQGPGSTSICRDCCQILSTRTCTGDTELSASGCKFHRDHPGVPFAVKSTITSVRLREMLRPSMSMVLFYIDAGRTDLMDVAWVNQVREENEETSQPKHVYCHGDDCLYGQNPKSIVQGKGVEGIYWKRCDGKYVNALGQSLQLDHLAREDTGQKPLSCDLQTDDEQIAELAWKRHNPDDSDEESAAKSKRSFHCLVM